MKPTDRSLEEDLLSTMLDSMVMRSWRVEMTTLSGPGAPSIVCDYAAFYYVASGRCWLERSSEAPIRLRPGDLITLPTPARHTIRADKAHEALYAAASKAERDELRVVCGRYTDPAGPSRHLSGMLPRVLHLTADRIEHVLSGALRMLVASVQEHAPGKQSVLNQVSQLIFAEAVRRSVQKRDGGDHEVAQALTDPQLSVALREMHLAPVHPWTLASLAEVACMSRSHFAKRFKEAVGCTAMDYLTELRMRRACEELQDKDASLQRIATRVGFKDASSFSTAFKRWSGISPSAYRRQS